MKKTISFTRDKNEQIQTKKKQCLDINLYTGLQKKIFGLNPV